MLLPPIVNRFKMLHVVQENTKNINRTETKSAGNYVAGAYKHVYRSMFAS